ncbi:quasimodo [Carabus blaptoides fortunei]
MEILRVVLLFAVTGLAAATVDWNVYCDQREFSISMKNSKNLVRAYLKDLRDYPDKDCHFHYDPSAEYYKVDLSVTDARIHQCGLMRVTNQITGRKVYYHKFFVEMRDEENPEKISIEEIPVKCGVDPEGYNHTVHRRNVLPAGFQEPEYLEITRSYEQTAPKPELGVGVRQNGALVTGELNVSPGTPLQMEIFLDKSSAPIYGLLVTHMQVTDTKNQEETIIFNGCSVDPYLFENFNTIDGDFLTAKFRAFKFPESTYVQFRGTVNVCLDKCKGVECSDGIVGYGRRRRRSFPPLPADPNKVFEITITSFIKVNYDDESENFEELLKNQTKSSQNKKLIVGNEMNNEDNRLSYKTPEERPSNLGKAIINEEIQYTAIIADTGAGTRPSHGRILACFSTLFVIVFAQLY